MFRPQSLLAATFLAIVVQAKNDWGVPCISGACSYDLNDHTHNAFGSILVVSSPSVCHTI